MRVDCIVPLLTCINSNAQFPISELKDYKTIHGHCNVPTKTHKELGKFVMNQRHYYKARIAGQKNSLTPERINDLEEVRCN